MAGNTVYVQGNYVDVHDNEVVNLNIDKASVNLNENDNENEVPERLKIEEANELWEIVREEGWVDEDLQHVTNTTLSTERLSILDQLLNLTDKGDWVNSISPDDVKQMLRTVLGLGETPLSGKEAEQSVTLWHLLENGRGDRVKIVWQNLVGYLDDKKLFRLKSSPALNKDFFGKEEGYPNIDKGRPSRDNMSSGFKDVLPLLDTYVPKVDKKA